MKISEAEALGYCCACETGIEKGCTELDGDADCPVIPALEEEAEKDKSEEEVLSEKIETLGERYERCRREGRCVLCEKPSATFSCEECRKKLEEWRKTGIDWKQIESNSTERD